MINPPEIHPAFLFMLGGLVLPALPGKARTWLSIALPALAFFWIGSLEYGSSLRVPFLGFELTLLRVDKLSKAFGYIFTLSAFAAFVYGYYVKDRTQPTAALFYIGSALGAVFAGDLLSLYLFWEVMAVSSTFLILASRTEKSMAAARRYILTHIVGGLVLLAGIVLHIHNGDGGNSAIAFTNFPTFGGSGGGTLAAWLILIGFLVNAAAPPLSSWLPDSYPESTVLGGVILSAFTTKTAVYALIRGFPGWEILLVVGCAMTLYGIIYALLENDMRRILAYSIINQVGFMVCAVGIGSELALSGAVAHAFCHIIYKGLLWMSAGAVLYRTGKTKCTELGGLYKTMPWTLILGGIGALAISAVPLTSGFTSKTLILESAVNSHMFWPWLILEIASAGVFLHAGIKFPYFVFFAKDNGLRPKEAPASMLVGMGLLAFLCVFLGVYPGPLYSILPFAVDYQAYTFAHVVTQSQLLIFSALVFFLFLPMLKRTDTIALDFDWVYRSGIRLVFGKPAHAITTGLFAARQALTHARESIVRFGSDVPLRLAFLLFSPLWKAAGLEQKEIELRKAKLSGGLRLNAFPVGMLAIIPVILLGLLYLL